MRMQSANPVRRREDDRLGRWPFARGIADLVNNASPQGAVVIGVEGSWGAGKSSVLEMAANELVSDGGHRIVRVSAWRTTSQEQFLASLAYAIAYSLRRDWSSVWLRLLRAKMRRQPLPTWLGLLVPAGLIGVIALVPGAADAFNFLGMADAGKVLASLGLVGAPIIGFLLTYAARPVMSSLGGLFGRDGLAEKSGAMEQFAFEFDVLSEAQAGKGRFVVMVEDLDRAAPERVADVIAAVAQLCGHERAGRLAFLVAYDRPRVIAAVKDSIVKSLPEPEQDTAARNYVDRVIQVGLPLPEKGTRLVARPQPAAIPRMPAPVEALLLAIVIVVILTHTLVALVPVLLDYLACGAGYGLLFGYMLRTDLFDTPNRSSDDAWQGIEETVRSLMPDNPRDAVRVANIARAAVALDAEADRLTPTEAMAIAAAVERWPESFDPEGIRRNIEAGRGTVGGFEKFMKVQLRTALTELAGRGVDMRCFADDTRLYRYFLAVRGAKPPVMAGCAGDPS